MVLWEITLGTAYFLGLKRTYRLALHIQRRLFSPKHPKIRHFLHRKTRTVFDATLKVHREVQRIDIEVGRNLGNWILKWLEKVKPVAQIRAGSFTPYARNTMRIPNRQLIESFQQKTRGGFGYRESGRRLVTSSRNLWLTTYPTIAKLLRRRELVASNMQYRELVSTSSTKSFELGFGFNGGVIRNDIMQWLAHG